MTSFLNDLFFQVPEHPVVSPSSGQVYERKLIEKYVQENGIDPISQKPLSIEDLIEIKVSPLVKPKPPSATSIPAILKSLQDEWDAVRYSRNSKSGHPKIGNIFESETIFVVDLYQISTTKFYTK